ncbi:MAG: hypothetical protein AB8G11_12945 [Saprospiraceae bacterium]
MKKILYLLFTVVIFLSSCVEDECTFKNCPAPDFDKINALSFIFDKENTYSDDEISTAHIIQYVKNSGFIQALDTFYFTEQFAQNDFVMVLSDPEPFSSGGTVNINAYEDFNYIIRPNNAHSGYRLSNIEVKGEYQECDCEYVNTEKTFTLDTTEMDRTGSVQPIVLD